MTQTSAPTTTTTLYIHDLDDHIIAELNAAGQTQKEYIWLGELPVAVVDSSGATPTLYFVHVDHLMRPVLMTDASAKQVWSATYAPFGATTALNANPEVMNGRFPGQWFQLETGLAYNWHRHYDPTIGRYIQPDPLVVDDREGPLVRGLADNLAGTRGLVNSADGHATAKAMGWQTAHDIIMSWPSSRATMQDGPSVFGYAGQNVLGKSDWNGLQASLACVLGGPLDPLCDAGLIVDGATIIVGICEMAKGASRTSKMNTVEKHAIILILVNIYASNLRRPAADSNA